MDAFAGIDPAGPSHRRRGGLAVFPPRAGGPRAAPRPDPDGRKLVGPVAGPCRASEPQWLPHEGRRRIFDALERDDLDDDFFLNGLKSWLDTGSVSHDTGHVRPFDAGAVDAEDRRLASEIASTCAAGRSSSASSTRAAWGCSTRSSPTICSLPMGVCKERLSQSALYYATKQVPEGEGRRIYDEIAPRG